MGTSRHIRTNGSNAKKKETKSASSVKIVLKKITAEELKNTRIASYGYIL
ncbi:MAG: hypothetical protein K2O69_03150 [Odoribacter sp.]|nr:hypothetical protein [Odoribacter sp.]